MSNEYRISAQAYLNRCAEKLRDEDPASLFYAAFELRCCVEARQAEYLEHYDPFRDKKIRPYRIGENAKRLEAIRNGDLIGRFEFGIPNSEPLVGYHTPVPVKLQTYCKKELDNLRHAQSEFRGSEEPWWNEQKERLIEAYRLAWVACKGDIPMPPLWNAKTGDTHPIVFNVTPGNEEKLEILKGSIDVDLWIKVSYLDEPPSTWIPDI